MYPPNTAKVTVQLTRNLAHKWYTEVQRSPLWVLAQSTQWNSVELELQIILSQVFRFIWKTKAGILETVHPAKLCLVNNRGLSSFVLAVSGGVGSTREAIELPWLVKLFLACHHPASLSLFVKVLNGLVYAVLSAKTYMPLWKCVVLFQNLQVVW